ncbi:unnamed protein product [Phaeothamnion confervicola]
MKPTLKSILSGAADAVNTELIPFLRSNPTAIGHASMIRLVVYSAATEADREPDTLMTEIAAMRVLFETAAATPLPDQMRARLRAAASGAPANFTLTALSEHSASMKAVLVDLHAEVEEISTPWARAIEAQVWDTLRLGADRRQLVLPGM